MRVNLSSCEVTKANPDRHTGRRVLQGSRPFVYLTSPGNRFTTIVGTSSSSTSQ